MSLKNIDRDFSPRALADVLDRLGLSSQTPLKVGFSGGLDSTVLLHALCELRALRSLRVSAVHVDHGLQAASTQWAKHCEQVCSQLAVPFAMERVQVKDVRGNGLEAAARAARYASLARHLAPGETLLTAHHADDQAETLLLQLLRGTGVHGMAAMPERLRFPPGQLVRPLLGFTRAQLREYAMRQGLTWVEDASNEAPELARNFLRQQVFPLLQTRWPEAARQMARAAGFAAEALELLDLLAQADWNLCQIHASRLKVSAVQQLPLPRQRNLIRYWLRHEGFQAPTAQHLEHILQQVNGQAATRKALIRWSTAEVRRYRDELMVRAPQADADSSLKLTWNLIDPLEIPSAGWRLYAVPSVGSGLSRERSAKLPLVVGLRQGGELCRLPGHAHRHKLKKLLQAAGVPPWERCRLPLIYIGGELAAVGDRWVCEPFAARPGEAGWKLHLESMLDSS